MKTLRKSCVFLALLILLLATTVIHAQSTAVPSILLGTAWYPEQWPEARWEADLALMQQAGVHMVRVGEFAWSRMEPEEGRYDLDWLTQSPQPRSTTSSLSSARPPRPRPPGSRRNIPRPCAPSWMAAKTSTATGSSSTGRIPNIARWRARWRPRRPA